VKLSPHFNLSEMIKSGTALRNGWDNMPNDEQIKNGVLLAEKVLEPVRAEFGRFSPSSWFRCFTLNAAIGSDNAKSDHPKGMAADFEVAGVDNYELACWIRDNLEYKQLILEYYIDGEPSSGWCHVSFDENEKRMQCLTKQSGMPYQKGLLK